MDDGGQMNVTEAAMRKAAGEALRQLDDAVAVLLFGSRARGTSDARSDWDVAVITREAERLEQPSAFSRIPAEVNTVAMPLARLREKRNAAGHLAVSLVREGRLLAGRIPYLGELERRPRMQPEQLKNGADNILRIINRIREAGEALIAAFDLEDQMRWFGMTLVEDSSDAAELFVKLAMQRRIGHFPYGHDLNKLAAVLERQDRGRRWQDLVILIRNLNGHTNHDHQMMYGEVPVDAEAVNRAKDRFSLLIPALAEEYEDAARTPVLAQVGDQALGKLRNLCKEAVERFPVDIALPTDDFDDTALAVRKALPSIRSTYVNVAAPRSASPSRGRSHEVW